MDLLIRNVQCADCHKDFRGDVYIKDGKVASIGQNLSIDCEVVEGEGLLLLPSFVDFHSHFRDPGFTYKEDIASGSHAAVHGGYTAVNLMANTKPICSSMETVEYVLKRAEEVGLIDISQTVSITKDFDGRDISHLDNIKAPVKFISDDGRGVLSDRVMYDAMIKAKSMDLTVISHAENEEVTPVSSRLSENLMTARDIILAGHTGCRLHIAHVSTREAMEDIIRAKKEGYSITCEVTPHHIGLSDDVSYRVNPPLRDMEDIGYLIKAVKDGWVDTISTDHAPHSYEDKLNGSPGMSGLETAFSVCYTTLVRQGYITINELSALMSKNPARMMGLNKGEISVGLDGDLVLVDIGKKYKVDTSSFMSKGKNTPFEGMEYYGVIKMTIKNGVIVYREGN